LYSKIEKHSLEIAKLLKTDKNFGINYCKIKYLSFVSAILRMISVSFALLKEAKYFIIKLIFVFILNIGMPLIL